MTRVPIIAAVALFFLTISCPLRAQQTGSAIEIRSLNGGGAFVSHNLRDNTSTGTNGVFINYKGTVLIADSVFLDNNSGLAIADGKVRIQQGDQLWVGEHIRYNFNTH